MTQCFFLCAWRAWNLGFGALEWGLGLLYVEFTQENRKFTTFYNFFVDTV
jgi:hypothetical protein